MKISTNEVFDYLIRMSFKADEKIISNKSKNEYARTM